MFNFNLDQLLCPKQDDLYLGDAHEYQNEILIQLECTDGYSLSKCQNQAKEIKGYGISVILKLSIAKLSDPSVEPLATLFDWNTYAIVDPFTNKFMQVAVKKSSMELADDKIFSFFGIEDEKEFLEYHSTFQDFNSID